MADIIEYPSVDFTNITKEFTSDLPHNTKVVGEVWRCEFNGEYIGYIAWDVAIEQYAFYPYPEEQLILTFPILDDIMLKIYTLMKERVLN